MKDPIDNPGWRDRVQISDGGAYAFRPDELVIMGLQSSVSEAVAFLKDLGVSASPEQVGPTAWRLTGQFDVEATVADLRDVGFRADPNHVVFSHGCSCGGCGVGANPFTANPFTANPFTANPFTANPFTANPFTANPFTANPFTANPFTANARATGIRASSARPAVEPELRAPTLPPNAKGHKAIVIDTGITKHAEASDFIRSASVLLTNANDHDAADIEPADGHLDPASGHGTFICGIIEQLAPGRVTRSLKALSTLGDGDAVGVAQLLDDMRQAGQVDEFTILNLSFGGYADSDMPILAAAIRRVQAKGAVVVASAGNDSRCDPTYPAALPGVVSVGSIEPGGAAPYSNYGSWVRCCAPGTSVISSFFKDFDGADEAIVAGAPGDPDDYHGWANWTGTSFAAPIVVAALLRHMAVTNTHAQQAVKEIVDDPRLFRLPGLGTVINLVP